MLDSLSISLWSFIIYYWNLINPNISQHHVFLPSTPPFGRFDIWCIIYFQRVSNHIVIKSSYQPLHSRISLEMTQITQIRLTTHSNLSPLLYVDLAKSLRSTITQPSTERTQLSPRITSYISSSLCITLFESRSTFPPCSVSCFVAKYLPFSITSD